MELREFVLIFFRHRRLFLGIVVGFVLVGAVARIWQPVRYEAEITMNVARSGIRSTSDYSYDDFYRLQADERFADTVVRWLESPRIVGDIASRARVSETPSFDAARLSSQVIRIRYSTRDKAEADRIASSMFDVLNHETESLNKDRTEDGWFALVGETPAIGDARIGMGKACLFSFLLGVFVAFFMVLFRWYWNGGSSGMKKLNS